ncbi:hypothetical protein WJX81_004337 [Elliptochloris bilobata]|uniref:Uncharacterized protein n=1 Tax=Elliptochloris bilobata TaxID=381761 RepID=A0AAW1RQV2_9CHLO
MDLLQLLASQQGEEGVRLTFLPGLLDRPRLATTALVAGHDSTAKALALVQRGVPLFWSRGNHSRWPQNFKNNALT